MKTGPSLRCFHFSKWKEILLVDLRWPFVLAMNLPLAIRRLWTHDIQSLCHWNISRSVPTPPAGRLANDIGRFGPILQIGAFRVYLALALRSYLRTTTYESKAFKRCPGLFLQSPQQRWRTDAYFFSHVSQLSLWAFLPIYGPLWKQSFPSLLLRMIYSPDPSFIRLVLFVDHLEISTHVPNMEMAILSLLDIPVHLASNQWVLFLVSLESWRKAMERENTLPVLVDTLLVLESILLARVNVTERVDILPVWESVLLVVHLILVADVTYHGASTLL